MVLLETCGQYFGKGSAAKRLNRFLAYLQRYLLAKPPAPLDVSLDLQVSCHFVLRLFLLFLSVDRLLLVKPPAPLDVSLDLQVSFASSFPCQVPEPPIVREAHAPAATM